MFTCLVKKKPCNPECRKKRVLEIDGCYKWKDCDSITIIALYIYFFEVVVGGRAPPLRPYTGCTALCPFRDRERPVGQRSSVPKIDKTRRLDRENQNWNHRQKLSDAQKESQTSPHCSKTDSLAQNSSLFCRCCFDFYFKTWVIINVSTRLQIRSRFDTCWWTSSLPPV